MPRGEADPGCSTCRGDGTRTIVGHSFNPALGRPLVVVRCHCVDAQVERDQAA